MNSNQRRVVYRAAFAIAAGFGPSSTSAQTADGTPVTSSSRPVALIDPKLVAMMPFRTSGADPALQILRDGLVELLAAEFTGEAELRAVEPGEALRAWRRANRREEPATRAEAVSVARQLGAGQVVFGSVVGTPARLTLLLSVVDVNSKAAGQAIRVDGSLDRLPDLVSRTSAQLLEKTSPETRVSGSVTENFQAVVAFIKGRRAYRAGQFAQSIESFAQALELDSTYAPAAYWLAVLRALESGQVPRAARADSLAWAARERLRPEQRQILAAILGAGGPQSATSRAAIHAALEAAARSLPGPEPWHLLGEDYLHYGALLGYENWLGRARASFEKAFALDSVMGVAGHMIHLSFLDGDRRTLDLWTRRRAKQEPTSPAVLFARYLSARLTGDARAIRAARERYTRDCRCSVPGPHTPYLPGLEVEAFLAGSDTLSAPGLNNFRLQTMALASNGGQLERAARVRSAQYGSDSVAADIDLLQRGEGDSAAAEHLDRTIRALPEAQQNLNTAMRPVVRCEIALSRLRRGDTTGLRENIASMRSDGGREPAVCATLVESIVSTLAPGSGIKPLLSADSMMRGKVWWVSRSEMNPHWNYDLALAFARRGDYRLAAGAARRRFFGRTMRLAPMVRDEGRWSLLAGDTASAVRAFRWYLQIRENPDPEFVAEHNAVRDALAVLDRPRPTGRRTP